jgi:hypothetical protein
MGHVRKLVAVKAVRVSLIMLIFMLSKANEYLGAIIKNRCPNDPSDVRCCFPKYPCNVDTFPGYCQDKSKHACPGLNRGYFANLCPGDDNVQCCLSSTATVDNFVEFLHSTYDLATQYRSSHPEARTTNELVMEWLRHAHYSSLKSGWRTLLGPVNGDWISFAEGQGHPIFDQFLDPNYCDQTVETDHIGATMNAVFRLPPLEYPLVNRGDFGGWGGDLITLYADWQITDKPSAHDFAYEKVVGNSGSFKLLDAIEDADGYNIAMTLLADDTSTIHDVAAEYYKPKGGYRTRFSNFFSMRFVDREHALTLAHEMLTAPGYSGPGDEDWVVEALRLAAIQMENGASPFPIIPVPGSLDQEELKPFVEGFVDALIELSKDKGRACT